MNNSTTIKTPDANPEKSMAEIIVTMTMALMAQGEQITELLKVLDLVAGKVSQLETRLIKLEGKGQKWS